MGCLVLAALRTTRAPSRPMARSNLVSRTVKLRMPGWTLDEHHRGEDQPKPNQRTSIELQRMEI